LDIPDDAEMQGFFKGNLLVSLRTDWTVGGRTWPQDALLAIGVVMYLAFRYAQRLLRPLGEAGTMIFLRLSAFILLCLGVQIVWDGVSELLRSLAPLS